jgi:sugar-specific transcriptional regulator TrmB
MQAGFTPAAAAVYRCVVTGAAVTIPQLVKEVGMKRTTLYGVLDQLVADGLLTAQQGSRSRIYQATALEQLREVLHQQERMLADRHQVLDALVPLLKLRQKPGDAKPSLDLGEGSAEVAAQLDTLLQENPTEIVLLEGMPLREIIGATRYDTFTSARIAAGIPLRSVSATLPPVEAREYLRSYRRAPVWFQASGVLVVSDATAVMVLPGAAGYGVTVSSRNAASLLRANFAALWELAGVER